MNIFEKKQMIHLHFYLSFRSSKPEKTFILWLCDEKSQKFAM